jgi:putative ABC transport system substrate-binding protein
MQRREFISLLGGAAAANVLPFAARAQQPERMRRIGVLLAIAESDPQARLRAAALEKGLAELGWTVGKNVQIDYRFGGGDHARIQSMATELVGSAPAAIVAGGASVLVSLQQATRTIPIVMVQVPDPVASGFIESLARPGGNITGFAQFEFTAGSKWVQMLKEFSPGLKRIAILFDPASRNTGFIPVIESAARSFGLQVSLLSVRDGDEIDRAIGTFAREPNGGLIVVSSATTGVNRGRIIELAARHRLPAVYPFRFYVDGGGLMSYATNNVDLYRQAASYVDRILRGAKPADLPVQEPTRFELVLNLMTAKALGIDFPTTLLALADEVIE